MVDHDAVTGIDPRYDDHTRMAPPIVYDYDTGLAYSDAEHIPEIPAVSVPEPAAGETEKLYHSHVTPAGLFALAVASVAAATVGWIGVHAGINAYQTHVSSAPTTVVQAPVTETVTPRAEPPPMPDLPPRPAPDTTQTVDDAYLNALAARGLTITNVPATIYNGHQMCNLLSQGKDFDTVVIFTKNANPTVTPTEAKDWVRIAVENYCPAEPTS